MHKTILKGIPKWFFVKWFLRPWAPKPNKPFFKNVLFGLAAFGGKAAKPLCSGKRVALWPRCPKPPKTTWPKKHVRIPLMSPATLSSLYVRSVTQDQVSAGG